MPMNRCPEGHFFDPATNSACPFCNLQMQSGAGPGPEIPAGKTVPLRRGDPAPGPTGGQGKTVRLVRSETSIDPVVGWLVSTDGPERGQDYRLHSEKNFIGRAANMDVSIERDESVSREKHAAVIFDPRNQQFLLTPGEASGLVYLNGELVNSPTPIGPRDVIELGATKLVLVPFVTESFRWQ